jgi:hypothetical protein
MRAAASFLFLALALTAMLALDPRAAKAEAPTPNSCIKFWGEVRYGALGYNHLVHVANACQAAAECIVSTDVNPDEQKVTVNGKSEEVVTTFMGSPARAFAPRVKCTMR